MDKTYVLSNGVRMPAVGFGTWEVTPDDTAIKVVTQALEMGYRHIDTAIIYSNERGVGQAIRECAIPRENIFLTTKLWNSDHAYDDAMRAIDKSLERLGLDYVDLYLVHWPRSDKRDQAWRAMQDIYKSGKAKAIGVSNYTIHHLNELLEFAEIPPMVNQIEFHPFIFAEQRALLGYCRERDIRVEAYSPLSRHSDMDILDIEDIARKVGKTPPQVILRWCLQHGTAPLPRSTNSNHIRENLDIFDFELDESAMHTLDRLSNGVRVTSDPDEIE